MEVEFYGEFYEFLSKNQMFFIKIRVNHDREIFAGIYDLIKKSVTISFEYGEDTRGSIETLVAFKNAFVVTISVPQTTNIAMYLNHSIVVKIKSKGYTKDVSYGNHLYNIITKKIEKIANIAGLEGGKSVYNTLYILYSSAPPHAEIQDLSEKEAREFLSFLNKYEEDRGIQSDYIPEKKFLAMCREKKECCICKSPMEKQYGVLPLCKKHYENIISMIEKYGEKKGYETFKKKYKFEV